MTSKSSYARTCSSPPVFSAPYPLSGLGLGGLVRPRCLQFSISLSARISSAAGTTSRSAWGRRNTPSTFSSSVIGSRGHMRAPEGWNSDLWLLALLFLFKNRWICGSLLGLGAFDRGWRQLRTATGSRGGKWKLSRDVQPGAQDPGCRLLLSKSPDT